MVELVTAATTPVSSIWVGAVQQATAMQPLAGWLWFDGSPVTGGWSGVEPSNTSAGALCECDGKPIAPVPAAAIRANRPPSGPRTVCARPGA